MDDLTVTQLLARMDAHKDSSHWLESLWPRWMPTWPGRILYMAEMTTTLRE